MRVGLPRSTPDGHIRASWRLAALCGLVVSVPAVDATAETMTGPQIEGLLKTLNVARIANLYEMGVLVQDPAQTTVSQLVLKRNGWKPTNAEAPYAQKWYRAMGIAAEIGQYGDRSQAGERKFIIMIQSLAIKSQCISPLQGLAESAFENAGLHPALLYCSLSGL